MILEEQKQVMKEIKTVLDIFQASEGEVRPHFIMSGSSGAGKSFAMELLAEEYGMSMLEINGAQLTKEGTAGNSLSKALSPLKNMARKTVVFVDEFDKLFISGNSNASLAHEITHGVQNEFLKILEGKKTSVYDDYGKYIDVPVDKVLFVFAGAFNGEQVTIDKLRDFGVKTEFIGRVGLIYHVETPSLASLMKILESSELLGKFLKLFPKVDRADVVDAVGSVLEATYDNNTLGVRMVNTLITQYFIKGSAFGIEETKPVTFQKELELV